LAGGALPVQAGIISAAGFAVLRFGRDAGRIADAGRIVAIAVLIRRAIEAGAFCVCGGTVFVPESAENPLGDFRPADWIFRTKIFLLGNDSNLASVEDDRIQKVLDASEFQSDYERQSFSDAAFTRASRQAGSLEMIRAYVTQLASHFPTSDIRRRAYDILEELLTSDGRVTSEESQLLLAAREVFQL
jgi:hypothetical protein